MQTPSEVQLFCRAACPPLPCCASPRVSRCAGLGPWGVGAVRTPAAEYVLSRSAAPLNLRSRLLSRPLVSSGAPLVPAAWPLGGCVIVAHDLEFHGVMRFYFQDKAAGNFATKCIRVSSTATTQDVLETLAEKFRPDMRMLSSPKYSLYEVHVSGEERRLDIDEKPLVVQLNWNKDDREGRFVLKNENDAIPAKKAQSNGPEKQEKEGVIQNFKRTLSKKEKKEKKKREKEAMRQASDRDDRPFHGDDTCGLTDSIAVPGETVGVRVLFTSAWPFLSLLLLWSLRQQWILRHLGENSRLAAEVYKDMPETSFTRTISNPEVVMKRRRQQKLEKRMQEFRSSDGRPDSGGTLRIYADSLKPNIPYKTILLSTTDPADFAVAEALEKYGLEKENPKDYCIARVSTCHVGTYPYHTC
ncbi:hypothetical protein J1605_020619 [Eschrichtius robustus]|uniref:Ras-associating domain-containing protein n=1 Tax=Eschrichtius robustus TaxID=9764 RepID=A0AB34HGW9_ESCRO|nr:hypothetical protein J1605_020619 [Eschrichtius robustus]